MINDTIESFESFPCDECGEDVLLPVPPVPGTFVGICPGCGMRYYDADEEENNLADHR